ncbi:MAG TPA: hypothetical protein VNG31_02805, partial [Candidatus Baltobacteraceae bacterium]|nr:hypothetical protein [Candidatus Baltobacteraceae bacterium]
MNVSRYGIALTAVCALFLGGCGLTSSPADDLTFAAPSGWQPSPGILGFMQFWQPAKSHDEMLMLFKSPKAIDIDQAFSSAKIRDARVSSKQHVTICGNESAVFVKGVAQSSVGSGPQTDHNLQMMTADAN